MRSNFDSPDLLKGCIRSDSYWATLISYNKAASSVGISIALSSSICAYSEYVTDKKVDEIKNIRRLGPYNMYLLTNLSIRVLQRF